MQRQAEAPASASTPRRMDDGAALPPTLGQGKSRWVAVRWSDLPGFDDDKLFEAWNAWLKSCERPGSTFAGVHCVVDDVLGPQKW